MSIPRSAIAYTLDIPEERVRCENCVCADKWINEAYICKAWGDTWVNNDDFCSVFAEREETDAKLD